MKISTTLRQTAIRRIASVLGGLTLAATGAIAHANGAGPTAQTAYPAKYQSAQQADRDEYECHMWAKGQSSFDPVRRDAGNGAAIGVAGAAPRQRVQPQEETAAQQQAAQQRAQQQKAQQQAARIEQRSVYDRGFSACMDARGYVVR